MLVYIVRMRREKRGREREKGREGGEEYKNMNENKWEREVKGKERNKEREGRMERARG